MSLLITPTILNSHDWFKKCPPSWKEKAHTDLLNTLNRKWVPPNHAVQRGIDFEKYLCRISQQKLTKGKGSDDFQKASNRIRGGEYQRKSKFFVTIGNEEYCCYGKIDVFFPKLIIDIKTTGSYKGRNSYLSGWQHKFYTVATKVMDFLYLIIEFDGKENKIIDTYEVDYKNPGIEEVKKEIVEHIKVFLSFIGKDPDLKKAYFNKFNLYS